MRIGTYAVPAGKSRKNIITTDKILTVGRHISADGIRLATLKQQAILHMWDSQLAAEQGCCCLIERFLLRHAAAAFYQYALAVQYLPFFLQPAVGGVAGGNEINAVPLRNLPKQDIADILRKIVMVEVDLAPFQGLLCRICLLYTSNESPWKEAKIVRCRSSAHPFASGKTAGYHLSGDH